VNRYFLCEKVESEEMEFDIDSSSDEEEEADDDDSGSEYKKGDESSMDESLQHVEKEEEEDDWMASDDEEQVPMKKKKKKIAKKVTITRVGGGGGGGSSKTNDTGEGSFVSPTPLKPDNEVQKKKKKMQGKQHDFDKYLSQTPKEKKAAAVSTFKPSTSSKPKANTFQSSQPSPKPNGGTQSPKAVSIPLPVAGVVNAAGTHTHNHLKFFTTNRKDIHRNPVGHPNYSPRTLSVDYNEIASKQDNGKVSPAQKQWWEIKAQYADTVLLFKTGKFYEMFHDDADVGVSVLGHQYMKGQAAHSGFPEAAYGKILCQLVEAGYKVARVEQTETPDALKQRKKNMGKGQTKPQVVCREVCSIVSRGTRTFCYLDDTTLLEKGEVSTGPLISIKEILIDNDDAMDVDGDDEDKGTKAVCEYGVTVVDAVTGTVTLGQFADDVLRSRLQTLLASFSPSEVSEFLKIEQCCMIVNCTNTSCIIQSQVLYEGGQNGASKTLVNLLKSVCPPNTLLECINQKERFPKSTAVSNEVRRTLDRDNMNIQPWDANDAVQELHRKAYYPRSSRRRDDVSADAMDGISRWPEILKRCIEGGAKLALSSFGAALFYLQRSLVDDEILSMGIVKAYAPPNTGIEATETSSEDNDDATNPANHLQNMYNEEAKRVEGVDLVDQQQQQQNEQAQQPGAAINFVTSTVNESEAYAAEANIDHMALDGTTLSNLEILNNITSGSYQGSLLSKIDATQSPHGSRLLRAWLLRPLFRKVDIDRRGDVVEELAGGSPAMAMGEARALLKKTGDIERLLSRVHSMGGGGTQSRNVEDGAAAAAAANHPNNRAVLYENDKHTKRKVGDFSKLLNGLRAAAEIPELFANAEITSPMLAKIVRTTDEGGCFPADMKEKLDWFFDNFDLKKAAKGEFEPSRGMDEEYDRACDEINEVKRELEAYKEEMCSSELQPRSVARSSWKYINVKEDSKDKYLIELPVSVEVPEDFYVKAKRGKGAKQVNKYRTPQVEQLVARLEHAIDIKNAGKAAGMKLVFARFDSMRSVWMAATHATAMLDALGSLAQIASQPGFTRPLIVDCPPSAKPGIEIVQGRHPCVDITHSGSEFIPNDLVLGGKLTSSQDAFPEENGTNGDSTVLLLSGPNMGGKSTLLRQTCLITILAQVGSFVPAERCALTPVDRIFTRLGASDRILCGQSTFFVELAETSAAVRGASRRSLVIMDELGRGTSTFDGTAIASATVKHLVEKNKCLTLFATHYHSLLEDWKDEASIKLGHMECVVEEDCDEDAEKKHNITFLYSLGEGPCPKSFGVNVARLAGLPLDVLEKAKAVSSSFEAEMNGESQHKIIPSTAEKTVNDISKLLLSDTDKSEELLKIWKSLQ